MSGETIFTKNKYTKKLFYTIFVTIILLTVCFSGIFFKNAKAYSDDPKNLENLKIIDDTDTNDDNLNDDYSKKWIHGTYGFSARTEIILSNEETKRIENLEQNDEILSYDERENRYCTIKVISVSSYLSRVVYEINNELITGNFQQFYTKKSNGKIGWASIDSTLIPINNDDSRSLDEREKLLTTDGQEKSPHGSFTLEEGDRILSSDNRWITVNTIHRLRGSQIFYRINLPAPYRYYSNNLLTRKTYSNNFDTIKPEIDDVIPYLRQWNKSNVEITVECSDNARLSSYSYEWTTTTDSPDIFDDGYGFITERRDDFTTLLTNEGEWYLHKIIYDTSANSHISFSGPYQIDKTNPYASISIENDEIYTNSVDVILNCDYSDSLSGVERVKLKNENEEWSNWMNPNISQPWTLKSGDGTKTVYYMVQDKAGNTVTVSDEILLDTVQPSVSIKISNGSSYTKSLDVSLNCNYSDENSGIANIRYKNEDGSWSDWFSPTNEFEWMLSSGDGTKKVYCEVIDNAGNIKQTYDSIILDTTSPSADIVIEDDSIYTNSINVTLFCIYSDSLSGIEDVRYRNINYEWSEWISAEEYFNWELDKTEGTKTIEYQVRDKAGNIKTVSDTIILDTVSPDIQPSPESELLDESNVNPEVNIQTTLSDSTSGIENYRYAWSTNTTYPSDGWSSWISYSDAFNLEKSEFGNYYLHVESTDKAGNLKYSYFGLYQINNPPEVEVNSTNDQINNFETVDIQSSSSDDDNIVNYSWDLNDDGEIDFYGQNISYIFNLSYNYSIKLYVKDSNNATTIEHINLKVNKTNDLYPGKNFITWTQSDYIMASDLAQNIGLTYGESITRFNNSPNLCDWDEEYIYGENNPDFKIYRKETVKIFLNSSLRSGKTTINLGVSDSLNVSLNRTLRFVDTENHTNNGYNAVPYTEEKKVRASTIAQSIDLENFQTVSIYDSEAEQYRIYLKLPGDPNVGIDALDPWIHTGDMMYIKVKKNHDKVYSTQSLNIGKTLGFD